MGLGWEFYARILPAFGEKSSVFVITSVNHFLETEVKDRTIEPFMQSSIKGAVYAMRCASLRLF